VSRRHETAEGATCVGGKDNRRRGQVQFRNGEGLVHQIGGIQMVERSSPGGLGCWCGRNWLLLLGLATELHAAHSLSDAGDTRSAGLATGSRSRIALVGGLITAIACLLGLNARLRSSIALGILVSLGRGLLSIGLGIAAVAGTLLLSRRDSVLRRSALDLAADGSIGAGPYLKGAGGVASLLLLSGGVGVGGIWRGAADRRRLLGLHLLARRLGIAIVWGSRHGTRRRRNRGNGSCWG